MIFFPLIFIVLFISSSDRVNWSREVSTEVYMVMFLSHNFYSNVYRYYYYNRFARCTAIVILLCRGVFPIDKLDKLENIIFGFNNLLRQFVKEVFFFLGNKKEPYALAITKAIEREIGFSDDS